MVERCFEVAEYPEVVVGENAAKVGGFESQVCWVVEGSAVDAYGPGLDIEDIQGVSELVVSV